MTEQVKSAQDYAAVRDWPGYFRAVLGKPPRDTLIKAIEGFDTEPAEGRSAIDLGCGEGRDTLELLGRRGAWKVLAIDESHEGLEMLTSRVPPALQPRLEVRQASFRGLVLPSADLVNASFCLPFCLPGDFPLLWETIVAAVRPGGRFAGQFFGERDDWAVLPDRTHHTREEVDRLLAGFELEMFQEEEKRSPHSTGEMKAWHVFHVVGRKR